MIKNRIVILALLFGILLAAPGYCQEPCQKAEVGNVTGTIAGIDWVGGKLVVKTNDFGSTDEVVFMVPDGTKVIKGTDSIWFSDLNVGDRVTVEYLKSASFEGLKAVSIAVHN